MGREIVDPVPLAPGCVCSLWANMICHDKAASVRLPKSGLVAWPLMVTVWPAANKVPSVGEVIVAVGGVPTVIAIALDVTLAPPAVTVNRAVYEPAVLYRCAGEGVLSAGEPSPKFQL